jgi:hypothetical protein
VKVAKKAQKATKKQEKTVVVPSTHTYILAAANIFGNIGFGSVFAAQILW